MKISKVIIKRFRSIFEAEILPTNFNVFVGQNNHGKTNFFEAVAWFFSGTGKIEDIRFCGLDTEEVVVDIEFSDIQSGIDAMKNEKNKIAMKNLLAGRDVVTIRRSSVDPKKRPMFIDGEAVKNPNGFDTALNDFLPKFEYITTKTHVDDVATYNKKTPIGIMLSSVLGAILENSPSYQNFRAQFEKVFRDDASDVKVQMNAMGDEVKLYLEKQFPDCTKVEFSVSEPAFDDLLKNFETSIDDGVLTKAEHKGDGMQRAIMLSIIQRYADFRKNNEDIGKRFLFFIDECELHLHPKAQRQLKKALWDIAHSGDQIFINTHSSVLVAENRDIEEKVFKVEKNNKITTFTEINDATQKQYIVYDLLGGSPNDLLLPRNFLIVEGRSEFEFISCVLKRFYAADSQGIQIVFAEGDHEKQIKSMEGINTVFAPLYINPIHRNPIYRSRLVIICDTPHPTKQTDFDNFTKSFPSLVVNNQLFQIPKQALELYYPSVFRKTDDQLAKMEPREKTELAKMAGNQIEQKIFESEMKTLFDALKKCWESAY